MNFLCQLAIVKTFDFGAIYTSSLACASKMSVVGNMISGLPTAVSRILNRVSWKTVVWVHFIREVSSVSRWFKSQSFCTKLRTEICKVSRVRWEPWPLLAIMLSAAENGTSLVSCLKTIILLINLCSLSSDPWSEQARCLKLQYFLLWDIRIHYAISVAVLFWSTPSEWMSVNVLTQCRWLIVKFLFAKVSGARFKACNGDD
jgi:hypothetical protein